MRIYRRSGSKVWWYYWRGERASTGFTDQRAAEAWFREFQRSKADPGYRPPDPSANLANELDAYITYKRDHAKKKRAPGTIRMYETHAAHLIKVLGAETPLAAIDLAAVERYIARRTADRADESTRWKEFCTLRGALKRAKRLGRFPRAIEEITPDDMQPKYVPLTRHLLLPDVARLMAELPAKRRAVVAFLVAFGADLGCVERCQPGDIDTRAGVARIRGSKTTHRDRVVPVLPVFKALAKEAAAGVPFAPWPSIRRDLIRAATRADVGPWWAKWHPPWKPRRHITARDLRRSHGRILRAAGVEPHLIAPMLGHAPGSPVTALTYAQITPTELGAQIAARTKQRAKRTSAAKSGRVARDAQRPKKKQRARK